MEVRFAVHEEIPAIVRLLKASLGESLMPKSEQYWQWKHINNPFGESPVLVALEAGEIIGVRAFMRWNFTMGGSILRAVRAVDTATHPKHQGKGIFSKLTRELLDHSKAAGDHLVFNTPNEKSKPGYLKMGWEQAGRLPVNFRILRPFNIISSLWQRKEMIEFPEDTSLQQCLSHPDLPDLLKVCGESDHIHTQYSKEYLHWRYGDVPVARYHAVAVGDSPLDALIIFRLKHSSRGNEFRIVDSFVRPRANYRMILGVLGKTFRQYRADFVTQSGAGKVNLVDAGLRLSNLKLGPMVTVRKINLENLDNWKTFSKWDPTLGDLELF